MRSGSVRCLVLKFPVHAILALLVAVSVSGSVSAAKRKSLKQDSTGDLFFLPDAHVVVVHGGSAPNECLGGTGSGSPCDVFFVAAPFVCGDCGVDFATAFHSGGNLTVGLGSKGTCAEFPQGFDYAAAFNPSAFLANEEKGALTFTLPVYFQGDNGASFALVRVAFIDKHFGLLEMTGNGALPDLTTTPVDVAVSLVEGNSTSIIAGSCGEVPAVVTKLDTLPVQPTLNPTVNP